VAKKPTRKKFISPRISTKVIQRLTAGRGSQVVDLGLFRQARDFALQDRAKNAAGLEDFHPLHAAYTYVMNTVTSSAALLCELPELVRLGRRIAEIEEDYMPSGPPMSPITGSYFTNWVMLDLGVGLHDESLGSCVAAVSKALGSDPAYVDFVERLCRTRPGFYVHQGRVGEATLLRELVTGHEHKTLITSGYLGRVGELLLLRLLPCPPDTDLALAMTTPYLVTSPGLAEWELYFRRTLGDGSDAARRYEALMKHGRPPLGPKYWTEYITEAYVNHEPEVIFLRGLPDVEESRPHSRVNSDGDLFENPTASGAPVVKPGAVLHSKGSTSKAKPSGTTSSWRNAGKILKTLPKAQLDKLPKLSETILKFGAPILDDAPLGAKAAEYRKLITIVEMAWNFPILTQSSPDSAALGKDLDDRLALLPAEVRSVIEGMFRARATTYAHDPRTARVIVEDDGRGGITVKAEARLLPGVIPE
jgi:hypothetical protein